MGSLDDRSSVDMRSFTEEAHEFDGDEREKVERLQLLKAVGVYSDPCTSEVLIKFEFLSPLNIRTRYESREGKLTNSRNNWWLRNRAPPPSELIHRGRLKLVGTRVVPTPQTLKNSSWVIEGACRD